MKLGGLTIAAVVLAALVGFLQWSNHRNATASAVVPSTSTPKILTFDEANVTAVKIKKSGDEVVLTMGPQGQWTITSPKPLEADQEEAGSLVGLLSALNADSVVETKAGDLKPYGLSDPPLELTVTEKDNKTQTLMIGDDTPLGHNAYAAVAGDARVFTISGSVKNILNKGAGDLRDRRLLRIESDKVSRIELSARKQDIVFVKDKDLWRIEKPSSVRTDSQRVDDLVHELENAKFDGAQVGKEGDAAAAFASGAAVATATLTTAAGTQQLQVRKDKDDYYAKSTIVAGAYKIPNGLGQALDKGLDDFRNKQLFDLGYETPSKIEVHDGPKTYSLVHNGEDWWSNGTKMDVVSCLVLVDKITALPAEKQVNSGFSTPVIDVTVTSGDSKRTEKVLISKNGASYVAKRDDEPGLYELSAETVQGLQQAADDVKVSAASAAK